MYDFLLAFAVLIPLVWIVSVVYNVFFSPLAKIPGPFFAKISTLPSFYHAVKGDRHIWIWQCHQIYGSRFRFQPNGVLFNSPQAYKDIYSLKSNVEKGLIYSLFSKDSSDINAFSSIDTEIHAKIRKMLNLVLSPKSIQSAGKFINAHVDRSHELLVPSSYTGDDKEWSAPTNISEWSGWLIFDILCDLFFGKSFDIKEPGPNPIRFMPKAIHDRFAWNYVMGKSPFIGLISWLRPRGLDRVLGAFTPKAVTDIYKFIAESVAERMQKSKELEASGVDDDTIRKDMFHYFYTTKDPETNLPAFSLGQLEGNARQLVIAGTDTSTTSVSAFFFYITRNPRAYNKLVAEIRSTFQTASDIVGGQTLNSCIYLRACLDEAMRMASAGPSESVRIVLKGGIEIDGEFVPEGVNVGVPAWTIAYNEEHWGDPFVYRPERWIVSEENTADEVSRLWTGFHPFLSGPGNCPGKALALLDMLTIIARTLWRFDVRLAPGTNVGVGDPRLGWGQRNKNIYQVRDALVSLHDGPIVQFKKRENWGGSKEDWLR